MILSHKGLWMKIIVVFLLVAANMFGVDGAAGHMVEVLPKVDIGKKLYDTHCAVCHHPDRIGLDGPPLHKKSLRSYKVGVLSDKIKNGFPQTLMPKYEFLNPYELLQIARYIKKPLSQNIVWDKKDIDGSLTTFKDKANPLNIQNIEQVLPVVEREGDKVWVMEGEKILSKFHLDHVHGGIKYTMNKENYGEFIFVPTRDGWVQKYSLKTGKREPKIRACINLRNLSISKDGKNLLTTCLLPKQLVITDIKSMKTKKIVHLNGKVSALYEFYSKDRAMWTYRDKPLIGMLDTKTLDISYIKIEEPIEDFFIEPFEEFIIATSRGGKSMKVLDLRDFKVVFEESMEGMPHLFSATYWYNDGQFYFATPHIRKPYVTVWQMYDWKLVKQINTGGDGFFVKTHPYTPYLWADNGTDELVLIDKQTYKKTILTPRKGKQYIHTEYSGDGKLAYLSLYETDGEIVVLDTKTQKQIVSYKANIPVGKYNFVNKNRQFYPRLFGQTIHEQNMKNKKKLNDYEKRSLKAYKDSIKK